MTQSDFAAAIRTDQSAIPVIDVTGAVNGQDVSGVANAIYAAATDHGFFYIAGHGIDPALMAKAFQVSQAFFDPHTDAVVDPRHIGVSYAACLYDPVRAGQHIARRNSKSFAHDKK